MCVTFQPSTLSNTQIYVGQSHSDPSIHVLAYQNKAISNSPNCMIIPLPSNEELNQNNVIDTTNFKSFLTDISNSTKSQAKFLGISSTPTRSFQVFNSGSYSIILTNKISNIPEALKQIPINKRPSVSEEFLKNYHTLYPNHKFALCCWDGNIEPEPLLLQYKSSNPDFLFVPTLDAHDGNPPNINQSVNTDHIISVGLPNSSNAYQINYSSNIPNHIQHLLPYKATATKLSGKIINADIFIPISQFNNKRPGIKFIRALNPSQPIWEDSMYGWY